ncbi:MAG: 1-acyl-sn-glycerol-3-phosphate acyltransferase [Methylophaga sp.]|nr:1-acyl-sn-glycerol-3-phosphate acyltransferase [Methylophaga sp.]
MTWLIATIVAIACVVYLGDRASVAVWAGRSINWIDGLVRLLCRVVHRLPKTYIPLPETGGALVVANHVSGLDPLLLISASRRPLRFLIAKEEYERPILHWLFKKAGCIPVDRKGKPELALRQALRALQAGEVIAIFPHGKIHLDTDPPRKLKGGVARLAAWSGVPIFPVRIDGVGGEGKVVTAPFIPSHVQLTIAESFVSEQDDMIECLERISHAIENK